MMDAHTHGQANASTAQGEGQHTNESSPLGFDIYWWSQLAEQRRRMIRNESAVCTLTGASTLPWYQSC